MSASLDTEFIARSESILTQFGFRDLKSFVKSQTLLMIMAKIEKFEVEIRLFEKKYGLDFHSFQEKIRSSKDVENFEEEDDYLDWRFAKEALERLKRETWELENA